MDTRETSRGGPGLVTEKLLPPLGLKQFEKSRITRAWKERVLCPAGSLRGAVAFNRGT